jgi:predicted metal-dependent hydrolase
MTKKMIACTLAYGAKCIPYAVEYRETKRLSITVHPDQRVVVLVPCGADLDEVAARVAKRASWIASRRAFFEQHQPALPAPRYLSGETLLYIGKQYRLKVVESPTGVTKLLGQFVYVYVRDRSDTAAVKRRLDRWYREHAEAVFSRRIGVCLAAAKFLKIAEPTFTLRKMTKRWGSCTSAGSILFNTELVKAPLLCIDYVIMHELCHLRIHSHGKAFYRLLDRVMPDWRKRKERLESLVL